MKKTLAFILAVLMLFVATACAKDLVTTEDAQQSATPSATPSGSKTPTAPSFKGEDVKLALLSGSTGLGASKLIVDNNAKTTVNNYTVDIKSDPTQVIAGLKTGVYDLAALPVNVAAKLYNMPDVDVELVALNTLGVLYVLEVNGETVKSVTDLKGKTVYTTGEGATPQYILEYVLSKNGLTVGKDVTVEYSASAEEVSAKIAANPSCVVMLPEPRATVVSKTAENVRYALDMTAEWNKVADCELTQGCIVATKKFAAEHKEALDAFLTEYKASVEFVNKADDAAAQAVVDAGIIAKAPIAKVAITKSNLVCYEGEQMKNAMNGTLEVLFGLDPKSVGGKLPGDDFYYNK